MPDRDEDFLEFEKVHRVSESRVGGKVVYNVAKQKEEGTKSKTLLLMPGATGDSEGGHIGAVAAEAYR